MLPASLEITHRKSYVVLLYSDFKTQFSKRRSHLKINARENWDQLKGCIYADETVNEFVHIQFNLELTMLHYSQFLDSGCSLDTAGLISLYL